MKLYKKVVPYVLAAMPLAMTSCIEVTTETGVVSKIDNEQWYYCDKDGDNLVDYRVYIRDRIIDNCVKDYIKVGDTISFNNYIGGDIVGKSLSIDLNHVQSVNNRSCEELYKIQRVNRIRTAAGQPTMR